MHSFILVYSTQTFIQKYSNTTETEFLMLTSLRIIYDKYELILFLFIQCIRRPVLDSCCHKLFHLGRSEMNLQISPVTFLWVYTHRQTCAWNIVFLVFAHSTMYAFWRHVYFYIVFQRNWEYWWFSIQWYANNTVSDDFWLR